MSVDCEQMVVYFPADTLISDLCLYARNSVYSGLPLLFIDNLYKDDPCPIFQASNLFFPVDLRMRS